MQPNVMKSAMSNGLIMGIIFSINFLLSIAKSSILDILSFGLTCFIVIGMYKLAIRFRDRECGGTITYGRSFSFILLTFFYAALISSIVKYFYFQFINTEYLANLLNESLKVVEMLKLPHSDESITQIEKMMKPATFSLQFIWFNVFIGAITSLILSAFVKKEKSIFED